MGNPTVGAADRPLPTPNKPLPRWTSEAFKRTEENPTGAAGSPEEGKTAEDAVSQPQIQTAPSDPMERVSTVAKQTTGKTNVPRDSLVRAEVTLEEEDSPAEEEAEVAAQADKSAPWKPTQRKSAPNQTGMRKIGRPKHPISST